MTLVELVVVITLSAIVVAFMAMFIAQPINAFVLQKQRAQMSDAADGALRLLSRDLRAALPNSVRTANSGTVYALEFLATMDGARYQDNGPLTNAALYLDFTQADGAFATTVPFSQITLPFSSASSCTPACYLSIYNVGVTGANAYNMDNSITPASTTISIVAGSSANSQLVTLSQPFQFSLGSPGKRVYLVSGPVSYLCDTSTGLLTRYAGYTISATQSTSATALIAAGATSGVVASNLTVCAFTFTAGTYERVGMATLLLKMTSNNQQVQLLHQVHLVNAP
jgi:MSHA biogenesis protein MshO